MVLEDDRDWLADAVAVGVCVDDGVVDWLEVGVPVTVGVRDSVGDRVEL